MEIKDEKSYIFDKTMKCNVCNKEFTTKQVRTGKARYTGTNDILKPLYTLLCVLIVVMRQFRELMES